MKSVKEVNGEKTAIETELRTIEVKTRLDKESVEIAVNKEQLKQVKEETIKAIEEDFNNCLSVLENERYKEKEAKAKFDKDFNKNEADYKGIFSLFNALAKGKSSNAINDAFYNYDLDKKFKFGKEYNGLFMLAYVSTSDLIGQIRTPQKFTTSQFKRAFKSFNKNCHSFKAFEEALNKAHKINELIGEYKNTKLTALEFLNGLQGINGTFEALEKEKVSKLIYSVMIRKEKAKK